MAHTSRKTYIQIFLILALLTALEVGVVYMPIGEVALISALIGLALVKAVLVALFFMHLRDESRVLKLSILIPMATPMFYALVLITEAAWRMNN